MAEKNHSNVKQVILAVCIMFVFVFFIAYSINVVYPAPNYNDFCSYDYKDYSTQEACNNAGGKWNPYEGDKSPDLERTGYCDLNYYCSQEYQEKREPYERNIFVINVVIGLIVIILSFLLSLDAVSNGFMSGGALLLIYGSIRYWGNMSDIFRTVILGIALAVLIWLGYKKFK